MKLTLTLILLLFFGFSQAQRVGIGITNPQEKLHVDSNIRIGISAWSSPMFNRFLKIGDGDFVTIGEAGKDDRLELSAGEFLFKYSNSSNPGMAGRVGININSSPTAFLEVNGDVKITDGTQGEAKVLTSAADGTASWKFTPIAQSGFNFNLQNANINVISATDQLVKFDAVKFQDGLGYNSADGTFTVPENGVYNFAVKVEWEISPTSTGNYSVYIDVNGSAVETAKESVISGNTTFTKTMAFGTILKLNALDVVKVFVRQESGFDQTVMAGNTSLAVFRLY